MIRMVIRFACDCDYTVICVRPDAAALLDKITSHNACAQHGNDRTGVEWHCDTPEEIAQAAKIAEAIERMVH